MSAKFWVTVIHVRRQWVTSIQLHIIHIPGSKLFGIPFRWSQNSWITSTCVVSIIFVDPEFQAFCVDLSIKYKKLKIPNWIQKNLRNRLALSFHLEISCDQPLALLEIHDSFPTNNRPHWCIRSRPLHNLR